MEETAAAFSHDSEGAAVSVRKRARMKSRTRAAARKALAVFVSVVLVVGLMPGFVAWGDLTSEGGLRQADDAAGRDEQGIEGERDGQDAAEPDALLVEDADIVDSHVIAASTASQLTSSVDLTIASEGYEIATTFRSNGGADVFLDFLGG